MVLNKKGISPLIATVLIIGFTVALAAVIMVWGQGFIKGMQEKTGAASDTQLICAQDVIVKLSDACLTADGNVKVTIKNDGSKDIEELTVRAYESDSGIGSAKISGVAPDPALAAFDVMTVDIAAAELTDDGVTIASLKQVEVIPVVEIEGKDVPCTQSGSLFPVGMMPDDALLACPA